MSEPEVPKRKLRYNKPCEFYDCNSWTREDGIFCKPHYVSLPQHIKDKLWSKHLHIVMQGVKEAIQYLEDKRDNVLIAREEGP